MHKPRTYINTNFSKLGTVRRNPVDRHNVLCLFFFPRIKNAGLCFPGFKGQKIRCNSSNDYARDKTVRKNIWSALKYLYILCVYRRAIENKQWAQGDCAELLMPGDDLRLCYQRVSRGTWTLVNLHISTNHYEINNKYWDKRKTPEIHETKTLDVAIKWTARSNLTWESSRRWSAMCENCNRPVFPRRNDVKTFPLWRKRS